MSTEDDTFRTLKQTPVSEMVALLVELWVQTKDTDYEKLRVKLIEDNGWDDKKFIDAYIASRQHVIYNTK